MYLRPSPDGHDSRALISALQKAMRRNDPDLAAWAFDQLDRAGYRAWAWRRILTTAAEDVAVETNVIVTVEALYRSDQMATHGRKKKTRVFAACAIMTLCRASKCRDADHLFNLAVPKVSDDEARALLDAVEPVAEIPDFVYDVHTREGRRRGRTKERFFRDEHEALDPRIPGLFDDLVEDD